MLNLNTIKINYNHKMNKVKKPKKNKYIQQRIAVFFKFLSRNLPKNLVLKLCIYFVLFKKIDGIRDAYCNHNIVGH